MIHRFIGFALALLISAVAWAAPVVGPFDKIVVFGDSLSDTGNIHKKTDGFVYNVGIGTATLAARPDKPFYTPKRFTNGPANTGLEIAPVISQISAFEGVWHEHLARRLNVPVAQPSLGGGLNYAYGGAETTAGTANQGIITNMQAQVSGYINNANVPADRLYILWGGGNDLINAAQTVFTTDPAALITTAKSRSITNIKSMITSLYNRGARKFLWPNVPPLEKTPTMTPYNNPNNAGQLLRFNTLKQASKDFRDEQVTAINDLTTTLANIQLARVNVYDEFTNLLANPGNFNITNATDAFVTTTQGITVDGMQANNSLGAQPDAWVFWDQIHPTSRVHALIGGFAEAQVPEPSASLMLVVVLAALFRAGRPCAARRAFAPVY